MDTGTAITLSLVALFALLQVRNILVARWGIRAIEEAHALNLADIDAGRHGDPFARYDQIPDHFALIFDLTVWRYRSPFKVD
jgi:hypothetical protein